jgi:hypothetical protein
VFCVAKLAVDKAGEQGVLEEFSRDLALVHSSVFFILCLVYALNY